MKRLVFAVALTIAASNAHAQYEEAKSKSSKPESGASKTLHDKGDERSTTAPAHFGVRPAPSPQPSSSRPKRAKDRR